MARPTLREIARQLDVSYSTVSLALRGDIRLRSETIQRIQTAARDLGYQSDPVVSEGLSRVRRKSFYRETLVWCCDRPKEEFTWASHLFASAEERARALGYAIDYATLDAESPKTLRRLAGIWKARGIRGVILAPFREYRDYLPFPWDDFVWVKIGDSLNRPKLHRVGRDYAVDLDRALEWLRQRGCRRPGFLQFTGTRTFFREPLLKAALSYYYQQKKSPKEPYLECPVTELRRLESWLKTARPDSLILSKLPASLPAKVRKRMDSYPTVLLSPAEAGHGDRLIFEAKYKAMGQLAINFMHHLMASREYGIPPQEQSMLVASHWKESGARSGLRPDTLP